MPNGLYRNACPEVLAWFGELETVLTLQPWIDLALWTIQLSALGRPTNITSQTVMSGCESTAAFNALTEARLHGQSLDTTSSNRHFPGVNCVLTLASYVDLPGVVSYRPNEMKPATTPAIQPDTKKVANKNLNKGKSPA